MSSRSPPHVSDTEESTDWDVDAELQKELDAVSICSHVSSSSSSTGADENVPADDPDRTNNPKLHKLLEDWRIKEMKLHSFETMLNRTQRSKYDILDRIVDQDQRHSPGPSYDPQDTNDAHCLIDPSFQCGELALKEKNVSQIESMTVGETSTSSTSFSQQCPSDFHLLGSGINCARFEISEQVGRSTESSAQLQEDETAPKRLASNYISQDFHRAEERTLRSVQEEIDFPCSAIDYEDALSMLRKKRMGMLEEYRATEAERLAEKNLKRQRETEESRRILYMASQRRQELEDEISKEKQDKIALLDLELAKRMELFEDLQKTEQRDLDIQMLDMEYRSRSVIELVDTNKNKDEELELRRLEEDTTFASRSDQEDTHEQAGPTSPDDQLVKCCVLIQSWIRGYICRKNYQIVKYQNEHALVSLLLPIYATTDILADCGEDYPVFSQHEDRGTIALSEEPITVIHGKEYQLSGAQKESGSILTSQVSTHANSQSPEEILKMLTGLAESGCLQDFESCLNLATSYGLIDEANDVETQFIQRKENVQSWLEQVVHGWETAKGLIEVQIEEAKRLEMLPITIVAEAVISAREKEIYKNLEASILKASRRNYSYWMRKAKNFSLEDTVQLFARSFQRKLKLVRTSLRKEAKLGTKEKYDVLFKSAISLGMQVDVNSALKVVLRRVLQVFKRALLLECTSVADDDSKEKDWNRVETEGAEIGLDSRTLAQLRQTFGAGRSFENVQTMWTNTFKANDTGGPLIKCRGKYASFGVGDPISDVSESQLCGNLHQFSVPSGISLSVVPGAASTVDSKALWSLPQNWEEINRLQRDWQEHTFNLRNEGNDNSKFWQTGGNSKREQDSLPTRFSMDNISATNPTNLKESIGFGHRQVDCLSSENYRGEPEEGSAEFSGSEEDLRGDGQPHLSEHQKVTSKKSILTRELLEKHLGCTRAELSCVMKLDLTDQRLKGLGRGQIFRWCPRLRVFTVDMNKLTTLKGVFEGGEARLEQVSVKDNLLRDMFGLESLGKVTTLHLDGNLLSQLGFPLSNPILANENGKKERNAQINVKSRTFSSQPHALLGFPVVEYCWPRLKVLTVGRNRLTKILQIGNLCPNLEVLDVGSNQIISLGGTEDNSLAGLRRLRVLDIGQNRLQGRSLWKSLENCPELASLVASRNKLRELPTHFGSVLLREIWLNGNAIKRLSCKAWLPSLQRLYLQDNMIDSLESLWGCPALEVLDLSFNSISELSQLRHLSCFPCLRSLQLNDNPVSEQADHTTCVLQAVPWLAELDNEAVAKALRDKAVTKIFKTIMDAVGFEFLKDKLSRGEVLLRGVSKASAPYRRDINVEDSDSNPCQFMPQQEVNNVLNGEADECSLWEVLSEAQFSASSSSIMKHLLTVNEEMVKFEGLRDFSESELESRSNMIAYQQMTVGLKGRLHAATKETCLARTLKEGSHSAPCDADRDRLNSCPSIPSLNLSTSSSLSSSNAGESNLEWCLGEHATFDSNRGREIYIENKEYRLQAQTQTRRVMRLQALGRGHLTRNRIRLLRKQKIAMYQEHNKCACKIQALWRGWKVRRASLLNLLQGSRLHAAVTIQAHWRGCSVRRRFRRALEMANYMDDDDFEYAPIDDSEFLAGEMALSAMDQPIESIFSAFSTSCTSASAASQFCASASNTMTDNNQTVAVNASEGAAGCKTDDLHGGNQLPCSPQDAEATAPLAHEIDIDAGVHEANQQPCSPEDAESTLAHKKEVDADFHELNQLPCSSEYHTTFGGDPATPAHEDENDASHGVEVREGTSRADTVAPKEAVSLMSPEDNKICATELELEDKSRGLETLEPEKKEENEDDETNDITGLLERIGIKSDLKVHLDDSVSEEEISRIVKEHLEGISPPSGDPKDHIETDGSTLPPAEIKKRATVEELAKDWGFKDEKTVQALLKARQKTQRRAKDVAHRKILQDPVQRLKRFKEKVHGQPPASGAPIRQFEKREFLSFSGQNLQMPLDEHESLTLPEPEIPCEHETNVRKIDGCPGPLPVPRLPHQQRKIDACPGPLPVPVPRLPHQQRKIDVCPGPLPVPRVPHQQRKVDVCPGPLPVPRVSLQQRKKDSCLEPLPVPRLPREHRKPSCCTQSVENKDVRNHPTKSARNPSAVHLSTLVLNNALQLSPCHNL